MLDEALEEQGGSHLHHERSPEEQVRPLLLLTRSNQVRERSDLVQERLRLVQERSPQVQERSRLVQERSPLVQRELPVCSASFTASPRALLHMYRIRRQWNSILPVRITPPGG
jgi:hypothetical protein